MAKKNPADLTLRNLHALHTRLAKAATALAAAAKALRGA